MAATDEWQRTDDGFARGSARARIYPDVDGAFVILTFGDDASADSAFACIVAAMRFGLIAIRADEPNRALARELQRQRRVRFTPFIGLPFDAIGVAAVEAQRR